jgi:hypothetical protein
MGIQKSNTSYMLMQIEVCHDLVMPLFRRSCKESSTLDKNCQLVQKQRQILCVVVPKEHKQDVFCVRGNLIMYTFTMWITHKALINLMISKFLWWFNDFLHLDFCESIYPPCILYPFHIIVIKIWNWTIPFLPN